TRYFPGVFAHPSQVGDIDTVHRPFEDVVVVVDEVVAPSGIGVPQGPHQEGGHLASGHVVVGTEAVVSRRVASPGDTSGGQPLDVVLEDAAVVVDERARSGAVASGLAVIGGIERGESGNRSDPAVSS